MSVSSRETLVSGFVPFSIAHSKLPLTSQQDSREPGPCRIHTGNKTAKYLEMDALERVATGGWRPGPESQQLELPAEGGHVCTAHRGQGDLQCPHCLQCFSDEQGEAFFRHLLECCQ